MTTNGFRPPRDDLVRAIVPTALEPSIEVRATDEGLGTLSGHFARFGVWNEIDSVFEGRFLERVDHGAYAKTIAENRDRMKVTFNHGHDPQLGDKVLGPITTLREEAQGPYYEVNLLDTSYNRDLLPGLKAGVYGASYRFRVMREELADNPGVSDHNPEGLPERTIKEAQVLEFGPVSFPADSGATAGVRGGVRSLTDEFLLDRYTHGEGLSVLAEYAARTAPAAPSEIASEPDTSDIDITSEPDAGATHLEPERSAPEASASKEEPVTDTPNETDIISRTKEEKIGRVEDIKGLLGELHRNHTGKLPTDLQADWDELEDERFALEEDIKAIEQRERVIRTFGTKTETTEEVIDRDRGTFHTTRDTDPFDVAGIYTRSGGSPDRLHSEFRGAAMKVVERQRFPDHVNKEDAQTHIGHLLDTIDGADDDSGKVPSELARRIIRTGDPVYQRAFWKMVVGRPMSPEEQRALSFTSAATGAAAVVYQLDPTIVPTSNSSVNPMRAISRVETISGTNEYKFATSGSITAAYAAEVTEASDNTPTLAQPDIIVEKAQAYVPFSIEIGQDWGALESEMGSLFQDAKDDLEATKFTVGAGHGSTEPKGVIAGGTSVTAGGTAAFAIADLYKLWEALPPRFRVRAQWMGNLFTLDKIRQFDTSGGSGVWLQSLQPGLNNNLASGVGNTGAVLLGKPVHENTAMASALTTGQKILVVGDFRYFVIVDRIGMNVEVVPLVVGTNHRPTGQRGLYAYWRNSSDVLGATAFQYLTTG